jgi:hypothetical protein
LLDGCHCSCLLRLAFNIFFHHFSFENLTHHLT